jgi:hypothetical protein
MKFIRQLDAAQKILNSKQVVYENVRFTHGFMHFLNSLQLDNMINEGWNHVRGTRGGDVWDDYRTRDGILLETSQNPFVYNGFTQTLTVSGNIHALDVFKSILERHASYDGNPKPEDIKLTHQYHEHLNEALWSHDGDDYVLHNDVQDKLLENAKAFQEFLKMPGLKIEDMVITGSGANYNWTEQSDIDLHLIIDKKKAESKWGKLVDEYFAAKKRVWNELHDIKIHSFPVEFYVEGKGEDHTSTGIYSIKNKEWVKKPTHEEPTVDDQAVKAKAAALISEINDVLKTNKAAAVEKFMDKLGKLRQAGLSKNGEFSTSNLAFKILRTQGYLEKLTQMKTKSFDRELSVEDEEWSALC